MLQKTLFISTVTALLLVGCGSASTSTTTESIVNDGTEISVERGPVHGALVLDANGQRAAFTGNGKYNFTNQPVYPITAHGGYIDVNRNAKIDAGEIRLQYRLQAEQGDVVTMASTIATNEEIRAMIKEEYGLSDTDIDSKTPSTNKIIAALSDEVYAYCVNNSITPINLSKADTDQIKDQIQARIDQYQSSAQSVAELEIELIDELDIQKLTESDLSGINQSIENSKYQDGTGIIDIPIGELNDTQKAGLIFMIEEEKVARDVYEHLYTTWGLEIFNSIAKAEQQHMDAIQVILDKYDLQTPSTLQTRGTFNDTHLQELYDTLIVRGDTSLQEALEVGKLIEEVDIEDLENLITDDMPEDIKIVYENLLKGSFNHLDAFNSQLVNY